MAEILRVSGQCLGLIAIDIAIVYYVGINFVVPSTDREGNIHLQTRLKTTVLLVAGYTVVVYWYLVLAILNRGQQNPLLGANAQ